MTETFIAEDYQYEADLSIAAVNLITANKELFANLAYSSFGIGHIINEQTDRPFEVLIIPRTIRRTEI